MSVVKDLFGDDPKVTIQYIIIIFFGSLLQYYYLTSHKLFNMILLKSIILIYFLQKFMGFPNITAAPSLHGKENRYLLIKANTIFYCL